MHISWDDLQLFLAVADAGSLTAAAKQLRVTQPTASRRLAGLESSLGEALFVREVSGVVLTSFGQRILEPARRMAEWAGETERVAQGGQTKPEGVVRITAPPGIAFDFVAPFAAWLVTKLPDIRLEVVSTVNYLDIARREADLALRMQAPTQRDIVSVASVAFEVLPHATKAYVSKLPKPAKPKDVDWIGWAPPLDHLSPNAELARMVPGFRPSFASDDFLVQFRAAASGVGAIFLARMRHRFSTDVGLVPVPVALPRIRGSLHLACAKSALDIPRIRAVSDLLATEIRAAVPL
jgi:DNA-binding transcriptional LysR family regulator